MASGPGVPGPTAAGERGLHSANSRIVRVVREHGFTRTAVTEVETTFRHDQRQVTVVTGEWATWRVERPGHPVVTGKGARKLAELLETV
jgi:hypothetical protein